MRTTGRARFTALRTPWVLAAGDAIAITLFAVIGLASHHEGESLAGVVRNAGPMLAVFFPVALVMGTYRRPGLRTLAPAWLVGVVGGVLLRAAILGHGYDRSTFTFMGVTLVVTGVERDGPAARAGLLVGDVLLAAAGRPVVDGEALLDVLAQSAAERNVQLHVMRRGAIQTVNVDLGDSETPETTA